MTKFKAINDTQKWREKNQAHRHIYTMQNTGCGCEIEKKSYRNFRRLRMMIRMTMVVMVDSFKCTVCQSRRFVAVVVVVVVSFYFVRVLDCMCFTFNINTANFSYIHFALGEEFLALSFSLSLCEIVLVIWIDFSNTLSSFYFISFL